MAFSTPQPSTGWSRGGRRRGPAAAERRAARTAAEISSITRHVYSEDLDPTSESLARPAVLSSDTQERTMADLINACLKDEMRRDPRIVMFGEDVGRYQPRPTSYAKAW